MTKSFSPPHRDVWSGLFSDDPTAEIGVMGVPFDKAISFRSGTGLAPTKLRELTTHMASATKDGQTLTLGVRDYGDVATDLEWSRYFQTVEERAKDVLQHPLALFLGGDHSVTIPLIRAFDRVVDGPFGVLHFDAHFDLFDSYDGHRWSHACTERRALELPGLDSQHLVFVGQRSFPKKELDFLQAHPEITYFAARQCYKQGIEAIADQVVEK
ncbi:MAG: arginase family protein [Chloroflexi bacterium]|nr:arginase family protein [Chloroflexota bacterium]